MSAVRHAATLVGGSTAPAVDIPATVIASAGVATIAPGGLFTLATRGGPSRRQMIWVYDLHGDKVGVIT